MKVCSEMQKLRDYLTENDIEWEDVSTPEEDQFWICRTHFMYKNSKWSVIHGYGTYGGIDLLGLVDRGLLEIMTEVVNDGELMGNLTADEVIEMMGGENESI